MARLFSPAYDPAHDPFASTVDDIASWFHAQSISKGGTRFNDLVAPSAANFPDALAGTPSRYFLYAPMRIDRSDLAGSRPIVVKDETSATTLTRVTGAPSNNEYRIPPENSIRRNTLELHSGQAGHTISYDYYGEGSMFTSEEWNKKQWVNSHIITADYTVLDDDWYRVIYVAHTTSTAKVTVLLPTAAANSGRKIRVQNTGAGLTIIDGEGAETISLFGTSLATIPLYMKDNYAELLCNGTEWKINHCSISINTNWISRSDWTGVFIGSAFTYDTKSAAVDFTGQHITLASGNTGVVLYDSGGTGLAGILYIYNWTGTGLAANNESVTCGSGGYTALVNEVVGASSKNISYNIYHGLGILDEYINVILKISADGTEAASFRLPNASADQKSDAVDYGHTLLYIDTNTIQFVTDASGLTVMTQTSYTTYAAQDDFIKIYIFIKI